MTMLLSFVLTWPTGVVMSDPLDYIDGCMDGTECPDADLCREERPEGCPLLDDEFELDPEVPLDKVINNEHY
jgi:hypothetical protein